MKVAFQSISPHIKPHTNKREKKKKKIEKDTVIKTSNFPSEASMGSQIPQITVNQFDDILLLRKLYFLLKRKKKKSYKKRYLPLNKMIYLLNYIYILQS